MPRVLLIGYGNTLRGDDALGPLAIERLRSLLWDAEVAETEFLSCRQLAPELAQRLASSDLALFVDAACDGESGTVRVQRLSPEAGDVASFTHHVKPEVLLQLAQALYGRAPQAVLVSGAGAAFESSERLSEQGQQALNEVCRRVPRMIREFLACVTNNNIGL